MLAALDLPYDRFCFACFDGNYPEPVPYDAAQPQVHARGAGRPAPWLTSRRRTRVAYTRGRRRRRGRGARGRADARARRVDAPARRSSAASAASAARFAIPPGYREPLLVASTDGVGTKTAIAAALGRFDTIGIDLVAMCADDVVCSGAEPLAFLDYVAVGRLDPEAVAELVGGVAAGCRRGGLRARRRRDRRASRA